MYNIYLINTSKHNLVDRKPGHRNISIAHCLTNLSVYSLKRHGNVRFHEHIRESWKCCPVQ